MPTMYFHSMNQNKSVRQEAFDIFKGLDKQLQNLTASLYNEYVSKFNIHYHEDRSPESWRQYCIARDVFLQHKGIINLDNEIRTLSAYPKNYASMQRFYR